jgi:hypothetical protein
MNWKGFGLTEVLSRNLRARTKETSVRTTGVQDEIINEQLPNTNRESCRLTGLLGVRIDGTNELVFD